MSRRPRTSSTCRTGQPGRAYREARAIRRREKRATLKQEKQRRKQAQAELRAKQRAQGMEPHRRPALPNRISGYETVEEETKARQETVLEQIKLIRAKLPILLKALDKIRDFRNPKKIKHQLQVVLIYGMLAFLYQMASKCRLGC